MILGHRDGQPGHFVPRTPLSFPIYPSAVLDSAAALRRRFGYWQLTNYSAPPLRRIIDPSNETSRPTLSPRLSIRCENGRVALRDCTSGVPSNFRHSTPRDSFSLSLSLSIFLARAPLLRNEAANYGNCPITGHEARRDDSR